MYIDVLIRRKGVERTSTDKQTSVLLPTMSNSRKKNDQIINTNKERKIKKFFKAPIIQTEKFTRETRQKV